MTWWQWLITVLWGVPLVILLTVSVWWVLGMMVVDTIRAVQRWSDRRR